MATTATRTHLQEEVQNISNEGKISRTAAMAFISGATIVFGFMIYYCLNTDYKIVAGILSTAWALVCIYGFFIYKSFK